MKRILSLVLILFISVASQTKSTITYIANEGFLIEKGNFKILVDAIFDDTSITYADVPSIEMLNKIINGDKPFDNIDVLLVTHKHRDHFSAKPVCEFLVNNPKSLLICNVQVVEQLKREQEYYETISGQVKLLDPEKETGIEYNIYEIEVCAYGLDHSPYFETDSSGNKVNRHKEIKVNGYIVKIDDFSLLHLGDSSLEQHKQLFDNIGKELNGLSISFVGLGDLFDKGEIILFERLKPEKIFLMHLPAKKEECDEYRKYMKNEWTNINWLTEPYDKASY